MGERVKIPLLPKQSKIKGAGQRQWSRHLVFWQSNTKNYKSILDVKGANQIILQKSL